MVTSISFLRTVQNGSGANSTSSSKSKRDFSLGIKRPARQYDKPPLSNNEVKNEWCSRSSGPYSCMACTQINLLLNGPRVDVRITSESEWKEFPKTASVLNSRYSNNHSRM